MAIKLICSISNISKSEIDSIFLSQFAASDDNPTQVSNLYTKVGLQYSHPFVCFIATSHKPKSSWIAAFGQKKRVSVVRNSGDQGAITTTSLPSIGSLFGSGVVIVCKPTVIDKIEVAAPGDISTLAAGKSAKLTRISDLSDRQKKEDQLQDLEMKAGNTYCEARIHQYLTMDDVEAIFSLAEYHPYTSE